METTGILGTCCLSRDPLVMYWNRDMLSAGLARLPQTWGEFFGGIAQKDREAERCLAFIEKAAVAFGEYANVG